MPRRCRVCARRGAFSRLRASARDAKNRCLDVRLGAQAIFADFSAVVARHRAVGKAGGSAEAKTYFQSEHILIILVFARSLHWFMPAFRDTVAFLKKYN